jgi:hypothetical protein
MHDGNPKRTPGHDAKIAAQTMSEIKQLDAGRWKGPQYAD